jgi:molybdopterin-containing oxidoreductase family iron-sulfur binding subunit
METIPVPYLNIPDQQQLEEVDPIKRMVYNPEVTVRMRGVMEKCTFCIQRIRRGKDEAQASGQPVADGDIQPACVQSCPSEAMVFGDLNDPESKVSRMAESSRATRLLEDLGTKPKVFYLERGR